MLYRKNLGAKDCIFHAFRALPFFSKSLQSRSLVNRHHVTKCCNLIGPHGYDASQARAMSKCKQWRWGGVNAYQLF